MKKKPAASFWISSEPTAMGRPRLSKHGTAYLPKKTSEALTRGQWIVRAQRRIKTIESPVGVVFFFIHGLPKTKKRKTISLPYSWCPKKPDVDNLVKTYADVLEKSEVLKDDKQIGFLTAYDIETCWCHETQKTGPVGVAIEIWDISTMHPLETMEVIYQDMRERIADIMLVNPSHLTLPNT